MIKILLLLTLLCLTPFTCLAKAARVISSSAPQKVNLVWQANRDEKKNDLTQVEPLPGVNVVSPCWFSIKDKTGLVESKGTPEAAKILQEKGYKVWALINNSFDHKLTHGLLANKQAQEKVIDEMVAYADAYQLDGYNLDFENINDKDKEALTQFVQDIANVCRVKNLTLSMDITVPSGEPYWSQCFDRYALGNICDYIMVMTYDQYHPYMHKAGSTAALNWVEAKVQETLQYIPAKKLVLGLPFYARIWTTTEDKKTTGKTIAMDAMEKIILEKNIQPIWLNEVGQYYLTYKNGTTTYQIWQEDKYSLLEKVKLVDKYNLAGIAGWRKGFETPDVWPALAKALSGKKSTENKKF